MFFNLLHFVCIYSLVGFLQFLARSRPCLRHLDMTSSQLLTLYGKVKNVAKREGGKVCKGRGHIRPTACPGGGVLKRVTGMGELGSCWRSLRAGSCPVLSART